MARTPHFLSTLLLIALQCETIKKKIIGQNLILYLKDMVFETRFDNQEGGNSCGLKGVVLSVSDYSFATSLKELEAPMEIHWEHGCITPLNL